MKHTAPPHSHSHSHPKAFTLVEIAVVIVIMGLLAALILPGVFRTIERNKLERGRSSLLELKNEVVGFVVVNKHLPDDLGRFSGRVDQWGQDVGYERFGTGNICTTSLPTLSVRHQRWNGAGWENYPTGPKADEIGDIAFVLVSFGQNMQQETVIPTDLVSNPIIIYDDLGGVVANRNPDDIVEYVSLRELRSKACTETASSASSSPSFLNTVPLGTPQEPYDETGTTPTEFKPFEATLSDGTPAIIMGENSSTSSNQAARLGRYRYGCTWTEQTYSLSAAPLNIQFRFQLYPGETDRTTVTGTADGFTMTVIPAALDIGNTDDGFICGFRGSGLGYAGTGIPGPKMAIEFDIYRSDWRNDPIEGNHVALLMTQTAISGDSDVGHGSNDNPACNNANPDNSACVFMYNSTTPGINIPAWLEWRNCDSSSVTNCEMELVDPVEAGWNANNNRTHPYTADILIERNCNNGCTSCGDPSDMYTLITADIECIYGSTTVGDPNYCGVPRTLTACVATPLNTNAFDEVRVGFTIATGGARTGLQFSHIDIQNVDG